MTLQFDKNAPIIVGFDPGEKTGIAVFDETKGKFTELLTKGFWPAVGFMNEIKAGRDTNANGTVKGVRFFIEDPNLNKPVFPIASETAMFKKALDENDEELQKQALRMFSRRAQNIGSNKRTARIFIEIAQNKGFRVTPVRPSKSKVNAEEFKLATGWMGKSSEHSRDAGKLIWPF